MASLPILVRIAIALSVLPAVTIFTECPLHSLQCCFYFIEFTTPKKAPCVLDMLFLAKHGISVSAVWCLPCWCVDRETTNFLLISHKKVLMLWQNVHNVRMPFQFCERVCRDFFIYVGTFFTIHSAISLLH